jgi:hypothetical protein
VKEEALYEQDENHQPDEEEDERQERRKACDRNGAPTACGSGCARWPR